MKQEFRLGNCNNYIFFHPYMFFLVVRFLLPSPVLNDLNLRVYLNIYNSINK